MGWGGGDKRMGSPLLTNLQQPQMTLDNPMSGIIGAADFTTTLANLDRTVAKMQADLSVMQAALRDMGGHQSMLLGYIHYLNPDNGTRPDNPMNYAEWSRLQQVSDVINAAKERAGEV